MKILLAKLFRLLFKISFLKKHFYGLNDRFFNPFRIFEGISVISSYDQNLKIQLDLDEWIQKQIFFLGFFDEKGILFIKKHLKPGDVFVDIGANIGCYTLLASKIVGKQGKVFAFEPIESVFLRLQYNIKLNNQTNIVLEKKAIFENSGTLKLYLASSDNKGRSSILEQDSENGNVENVDAVSIDDYLANHIIDQLNLIKIDIEGAELYALKGMKNTIRKFRPIILAEVSEDVLKNSTINTNEILDFFNEFNYQQFAIDRRGDIRELSELKDMNYHNYVFFPR